MDTEKSLYYVCEFPEEEVCGSCPTAIISSVWAFEDDGKKYCFWPNFKSDKVREKALFNHTPVGPENGSMCRIIIKYKTDMYEKARQKLKLLEQTSDLESQNEERPRVVKIRQDYVSDIDSSDEDLPKPPKFKINNAHNNVLKKTQEEKSDRSTPDEIPAAQPTNLVDNPSDLHEILKEILRNQQKFNEKVDYLTNLLQHSLTQELEMATNDSLTKLPLMNLDGLKEFNNKLQDEDYFQKHVVHLKLIGGKDGPETTRRILKKMIGHDLSVNINWSGRNEKPAFAEYKNVIKLINETVRKNPITSDITNNAIEGTIKLWLRGAMDREGGRSKREK